MHVCIEKYVATPCARLLISSRKKVFRAHRLLHHSTLGSRVINKKKKVTVHHVFAPTLKDVCRRPRVST